MKHTLLIILLVLVVVPLQSKTIFVNMAATGSTRNGTSWATAYTDLKVACDNASGSDTIWVANGTYTIGSCGWPCIFELFDGVKMYGGFTGTETALSQRVYTSYQTIINGTASPFFRFHPVYIGGSTSPTDTVRLDGFKIVGGRNYGVLVQGNGWPSGSTVIENCIFDNNIGFAALGVGATGNVRVKNCQFLNNGIDSTNTYNLANGGAIQYTGKNLSAQRRTGMLEVTDCVFLGNRAKKGGAVFIYDSSYAVFNRCVFAGNTASIAGGAFYDSLAAHVKLLNSLVLGNTAPMGAALYTHSSALGRHNILHTTISGNSNTAVGLIPNHTLWLRDNDTLRNCILWGDTSLGTASPSEVPFPGTNSYYNKNIIRNAGFLASTNTYLMNPRFVNPGKAANAPFASISGYDYHLDTMSDAIDTGLSMGLTAPYNLDLDGKLRAQGPWPDLGAYEWKACSGVSSISASGPTTFCLPDSVLLTANLSSLSGSPLTKYKWSNGARTKTILVKTSGLYKAVILDTNGCRASSTITVTAISKTPPISQNGSILSVPAVYTSYQWYLNGIAISGATGPDYNASTPGTYTVSVNSSLPGCSGTSPNYQYRMAGINDTTLQDGIQVYPNPSSDGSFWLSIEQLPGDMVISIQNLNGQRIYWETFPHTTKALHKKLDLSHQPKGMYFLYLTSSGYSYGRKLIVH